MKHATSEDTLVSRHASTTGFEHDPISAPHRIASTAQAARGASTIRRILARVGYGTVIVAGAMFFHAPAYALPTLTGDINFDGSDSYDASTVTFIGSQGVTSANGSLSSFGICAGCITAQNITYSPFSGPLNAFLSGTNTATGLTFSLDVLSVFNIQFQPANDLDFDSAAVLHLTGFADTPGEMFFSTQGPNGPEEVSFSATALPVAAPEPASLALLGVGLLGLGMVASRKRQT